MIDTHAHIYLPELRNSFQEIIERAKEAGLKYILMPGIENISWQQMQEVISLTDFPLLPMYGIHPCDVKSINPDLEVDLIQYGSKSEVVGIGETGLDYYWSQEFISEQKVSFLTHCDVAKQLGKPIVIHNRESTNDVLDCVESKQDGRLKGVWHCFTGSLDEGKRAIDLGLHLGIGGVVTFKNGGIDKFLSQLPIDKLLLETDTPYLAPVPHRGKQNEPSFVRLVRNKMALLFDVSPEEITAKTTRNAKRLFSLN